MTWSWAPATPLQWGHERALVEILLHQLELTARHKLQWGHERALVEILSSTGLLSAFICFNGATSARSWKFISGYVQY